MGSKVQDEKSSFPHRLTLQVYSYVIQYCSLICQNTPGIQKCRVMDKYGEDY